MPLPQPIASILKRADLFAFSENRPNADALARQIEQCVASPHPMGMFWHPPTASAGAGLRVLLTPTGHAIFYGSHGHRILCVDPGGTPLHECAWNDIGTGPKLLYARLYLDWGQWIGIKPEGLVNVGNLDLSKKPGWQRLTTKDLQMMAAQALQVTPEEIAFFYDDQSMALDAQGRVTIRHRKDALYILDDGSFAKPRFMACMGAMHWGHIDFLPVVELFQSLLPGTGSAVFELIRGLYDDQNEGNPTPRPLRYRGIPTYPSKAAFRLLSSLFTPQAPGGSNPFMLFMNPERSNHVIWLPAGTPPIRYFDQHAGACLTLQGGLLHKVTVVSDSSGLSYMSPKGRRFVPCDRSAEIVGAQVILKDRDHETTLAVTLPQGRMEQSDAPVAMSPVDWRSVFVQGVPHIPPADAYGAVLLYPEDESEIGACAAQPFLA